MLPTKPLGQTDLRISPIGLGTVKLGRDQQVKYPQDFIIPSDEETIALLDSARELGINLLDTAPAYGTSEERLGKLLAKQRKNWIISTKVGEEFEGGISSFNFRPEHLKFSVERSLRRLRSDYLDLVLVHSDGNDCEIIERYEVFAVLSELKRAGWLRSYGMSGKTLEGGLLAAQHADVVMVTYNLTQRDQVAVIDKCQSLNKGVLIKKALGSGHLCLPEPEQQQGPEQEQKQELDKDPIQTGMNFIFSHKGVNSAIIGTINPLHLRDNVAKALIALNQD